MLYYGSVKSNNSNECIVCHYWYFNHGFKFILIMGLNLKIPFVMVAMIWQRCVLILVILLLSLLKVLVIVELFMILANLMQYICCKILCLMIVGLYTIYIKEINIKKIKILNQPP